jgi:hypothetical protein
MSYFQRVSSIAVALLLLTSATQAAAQGIQVGTISGIVRSSDQQPLPGVTVTATSASLQGESFGVSDSNGVYSLQGLPSGAYTVSFVLSGFQSATRDAIAVRVGGVASVDAMMSVATLSETVTVTAEAPSPLTSAPRARRSRNRTSTGCRRAQALRRRRALARSHDQPVQRVAADGLRQLRL